MVAQRSFANLKISSTLMSWHSIGRTFSSSLLLLWTHRSLFYSMGNNLYLFLFILVVKKLGDLARVLVTPSCPRPSHCPHPHYFVILLVSFAKIADVFFQFLLLHYTKTIILWIWHFDPGNHSIWFHCYLVPFHSCMVFLCNMHK
jgi:hypothetical protein